MLWFRISAVAAALCLATGLSGCFQPLYSESAHPGLVEDLRAIEVTPRFPIAWATTSSRT